MTATQAPFSLPVERTVGSGVSLLSAPYPYRGLVSIANDCDGMMLDTFETLHRFLNSREETPWGEGLGLDVADSFWVFGPRQTTREIGRRGLWMINGDSPEDEADLVEILAMYVRAGWMDTLHSIGRFPPTGAKPTRAHAEHAAALFRRYGLRTPVWINHGGSSNEQNIGPWEWAKGGEPGSSCFLLDLLEDFGVCFIADERQSTGLDPRITDDVTRSELHGYRYWSFTRWRALPLQRMPSLDGIVRVVEERDPSKSVAKLGHATALHHQLAAPVLDRTAAEGRCLILAQHLGWLRGEGEKPFPLKQYPESAIEALRRLRRYQDERLLLVARTSRALGFLRAKRALRIEALETEDALFVECSSPADETFSLDALRGLSFSAPAGRELRIVLDGRPVPASHLQRVEEDGAAVTMVRWHETDPADHSATRAAMTGPRRSPRTEPVPKEEIPVIKVEIDQEELAKAGEWHRRGLVHAVLRQGQSGFFAAQGVPEKEWAYIDLDDYPGFEEFLRQCKRVQRGAALRQARKASDRGYSGKFFNPRMHLDDLVELASSAPVRQGQLLAAHYFRSAEERGGYPAESQPEVVPDQALVWNRYFGIFAPAPGHRQGDLVVDERLLAYIKLRRCAELAFYGTILGHADHLAEGIMYRMQLDLMEHLFAQRERLAEGAPDADQSLRGLRYVLYSRFFDTEGLVQWKKKMLFRPGYFVFDVSGVSDEA